MRPVKCDRIDFCRHDRPFPPNLARNRVIFFQRPEVAFFVRRRLRQIVRYLAVNGPLKGRYLREQSRFPSIRNDHPLKHVGAFFHPLPRIACFGSVRLGAQVRKGVVYVTFLGLRGRPFVGGVIGICRDILPIIMAYLPIYLFLHGVKSSGLFYDRLIERSNSLVRVLIGLCQRGCRKLIGVLVRLIEDVLQSCDSSCIHLVRQ